MRQVHHLKQLIDILVSNTSTGEVSPEVMRLLVLNDTSLIKDMLKCGLMPIFFFPKCIQRLHPVLTYYVSNKEL